MAQSRHTPHGEIRIPKNRPYNRIRHIQWNNLDDTVDAVSISDDVEESCDDNNDKTAPDEPKVWTF